jgi:hypothetical protein
VEVATGVLLKKLSGVGTRYSAFDRELLANLAPPPTSFTTIAKDWLEDELAAQERPFFSAIANAQPIDFSAMAAEQQSCPEVYFFLLIL